MKSKPCEVDTIIVSTKLLSEDTYLSHLSCPKIAEQIQPGQFINIKAPGNPSELLRIPLSYSKKTNDGIDIIYQVIGSGTKRLSEQPEGTKTNMLAPLGRGYSLPAQGERVLLVGGGSGTASILSLAQALAQMGANFDVALGFQTESKIFGQKDFEDFGAKAIHYATDDGSFGYKGYAPQMLTELFEHEHYDRIYSCGPKPMTEALVKLAKAYELEMEVSLETGMICGFGACASCVIDLADGSKAGVCKKGPVFNYKDVKWDE